MRKIIYLLTFLIFAPLTILASGLSLLSLNYQNHSQQVLSYQTHSNVLLETPKFGVQVYAALPGEQPLITSQAIAADARVEIVKQYLIKYNSPLLPLAELIVVVSDQYNLDYRLLVAIAQQESNLCKKAPLGSNNCWGWGIHSRGTLSFPDYATAIQTVAKGIKEEYLDKGYNAVKQMMEKYTPLSNGSWAAGVNQFMAEME